MTVAEFELLTDPEKLDLLYQQGVYIGKCVKEARVVILLQLESFYVEIFYRKYRRNVHRIHAFTSPEGIDEYLERINIEYLSL